MKEPSILYRWITNKLQPLWVLLALAFCELVLETVAGDSTLYQREPSLRFLCLLGASIIVRQGERYFEAPEKKAGAADTQIFPASHQSIEERARAVTAPYHSVSDLFRWCVSNAIPKGFGSRFVLGLFLLVGLLA